MKIVVLAGGISTERDVSLSSGRGVYNALKERGHQVILLDVFLGYEGDPGNIFELDRDWVKDVAPVSEVAPETAERMARCRQFSICLALNIQEPIPSAVRLRWISPSPSSYSCKMAYRLRRVIC